MSSSVEVSTPVIHSRYVLGAYARPLCSGGLERRNMDRAALTDDRNAITCKRCLRMFKPVKS